MKYKNLIIEKSEYDFIKELLSKVGSKDVVHQKCYERLREELQSAEVRENDQMPEDVVRIKSIIDIKTSLGQINGYQLVVPKDSNTLQKKLSILTPMGSALFGYAASDKVKWNFPRGEEVITIVNVYQDTSVNM